MCQTRRSNLIGQWLLGDVRFSLKESNYRKFTAVLLLIFFWMCTELFVRAL